MTEQITLWQNELRRLSACPAMLYDRFESEDLYRGTADTAERQGLLLWRDNTARAMAVPAGGAHEVMKGEIRALKAQLGV